MTSRKNAGKMRAVLAFSLLIFFAQTASAQINTGKSATEFAVFAKRDVTFEAYSSALGDVYAGEDVNLEFAYGIQRTDRNQGDFYAGRDFNTFGGLHDIDGSVWANRHIDFDTDFGVEVTGNAVYGNSITSNAASIVEGSIAQQTNSVPNLRLPEIASFSAGSSDFVELSGQNVVTLAPGAYRDVRLTSQTDELHLSSGDYYMRNLETWISTELHFDLTHGAINVYIEEDAFFESGLTTFLNGVEIVSTSDTPPANVELASLVTFEVHEDVTIDSGFLSTFAGTIFTPFGDVNIDTQSFYGSIISGRNVSGDFYIEHHASNRLAIPEPNSCWILGMGVAIWAVGRRRQKRQIQV